MVNITQDTISTLDKLGVKVWFSDNNYNECGKESASLINIVQVDPYLSLSCKALKKEFTVDLVMGKLLSHSGYKHFANDFKNVLPEKYKNSINVYAASYGIGVVILYNSKGNEAIEYIKTELSMQGIKYRTEYSEGHYVYRFIILRNN